MTSLIDRRDAADARIGRHRAVLARDAQEAALSFGVGIDPDDNEFRRLTSGAKFRTRDLAPLAFERALDVSWYLFEQNPFARRLLGLMTDLIIGDGVTIEVTAEDPRVQGIVDTFWNRNRIDEKLREFYTANALNGEVIFPVGVNEVSGNPVLGYLDSTQIRQVTHAADNVMVRERVVLKGLGLNTDESLAIINEDPVSRRLTGQVFFHPINTLPNSMRGRPDLLALADWLDLYDQFMFAELERINLLSAFAWDYTVEDAKSEKEIADKVAKLPKLKAGAVFGHNQKEKLEPRTPDMKAQDRSEVARLLRIHIAGNFGFPISYFGDIDSNRSTIEGQNDVLMKTPAARQREFAGLLHQMVRFAIEQSTGRNPALYVSASPAFSIGMPEIAAKDVARVGQVLVSTASAIDTTIANRTLSRATGIRVMATMINQLGVKVDVAEIAAEIEAEEEDRQALQDDLHAEVARQLARRGPTNPPIPDDNPDDE